MLPGLTGRVLSSIKAPRGPAKEGEAKMRHKTRKLFAYVGLGLAGILFAVACGTGDSASSSGGGTAAGPPAYLPGDRTQAQAGSAVRGAAGTGAPGQSQASAPDSSALPPVPPVGAEGQKIIRTANLGIEVPAGRLDDKLTEVETLIRSQGGYISGSTAQAPSGDGLRTGTFNFQVPAANFDVTLDALRKLGKVQSFNVSGQDVSLQYVDLQARLKNAEAQRDAIQALLARAQTIQEIIQVQNQLGQITAQVEQLKGQIDYFDHATSFHTVSVTLREAGLPARSPSDEWGTRTALADALHNFVTTLNYAIVALGAVGPFILLGVIGFGGYRVWRSRSKAAAAGAPA